MDEVRERRAKKEGKVTPKACIQNLLEAIERGEVEVVVFVTKQPDGIIRTGWSEVLSTEAIGMLECGKDDIFLTMRD